MVTTVATGLRLPAIIGQGMVLQRGQQNPLWGWDAPGQQITVTVNGQTVDGVAGDDGRWQVQVPELPAGGPYTVEIAGSTTRIVREVLVGEVWLASGQSNMQMAVNGVLNQEAEIAAADFPQIRLFTVPCTIAHTPQEDTTGAWEACAPETVGGFSAVAYFFGSELYQQLGVPIGLINTSWGGTPAEAWTSRTALLTEPGLPGYAQILSRSQDEIDALRDDYRAAMAVWEDAVYHKDPGIASKAAGWAAPECDDTTWAAMKLPCFWQTQGLHHNGAVWFRNTVEIPAAWAGRDLQLSLGAVDDFDTTFWDGKQVGALGKETPNAYITPRVYTIPAALVQAGSHTIAVRVFDHFGQGGFAGQPSQMALLPLDDLNCDPLPLAGQWKYHVELALNPPGSNVPMPPPPAGPDTPHYPSVLYNAMIAPLIPFGVRGAIWYQGESNAGRATEYATLFPTMIRNWRKDWGQGDFPFYFVQLANFISAGNWAWLREAQTQTLALPNTGMAVIIDIGDPVDIHPRDKQNVGHRLALIARANAYGEQIPYSGPLYESMTVEGDAIRLHFAHTDGGLTTQDGQPLCGFLVAGADKVFVPAEVTIDGNTVLARGAGVSAPQAVRYGWEDNPACNLTNGTGLPASPFRTDAW